MATKLKSWTITGSGNGEAADLDHHKKLQFVAWGTWDGATIALEFSPNGGTTYIPVRDRNGNAITLTRDDAKGPFTASQGHKFRPVTSGAGGSTSLNTELREVV